MMSKLGRWRKVGTAIVLGSIVAAVTGCGEWGANAGASGSSGTAGGNQDKITNITIAAQDFSEPVIDDYMIKDLIEAKTPLKVTIKTTSGASGLMHSMLTNNSIQIYTGYDGTEFTGPLRHAYTGQYKVHPDSVSQYVVQQEMKQWDIWVSPSLGYEDTYALAVRVPTAKKDHLTNVSSAVPYARNWMLGTDPTFQVRQSDGLPAFESMYGVQFKQTKGMSYDLMYPALATGAVDAAIVYSTDGRLKKLNEVPLTDDKHFFPPYHAVVLINGTVEKQRHLDEVLKPLFGAITDADQTEMNYEADVLKMDPQTIAHNFLVKHGLLSK